jgi:hypothetical protein
MKRFINKKVAVVGLTVALVMGVGGAAFAYFSSTGGGTGSAGVGTSSNLVIHQLGSTAIYNSTVSPSPADWWSEAFSELNVGFGPAEIGDAVTLASTSAPLNNVVVMLDNWACEVGNGNGPNCVTADPGLTYPATLTFNIYDPANLVTPIATDTQTFAIPYRPSADPTNCPVGAATWAAGYTSDGSQWYDPATKTCNWGQVSPVTFNFSPQDIMLPKNVVYGISYTPNSTSITDPSNYLNVVLSTEPTDVTVGSDNDLGNIFMDVPVGGSAAAGPGPSGAAGAPGQMSCTPAASGFLEYSTAAGLDGCGAGATNNIPAVQFNTGGIGDLYPGTSQPISFSVTNPGGGNEFVNSVAITVAAVSQTPAGLLLGTCEPGWFTISPAAVPFGFELAPGTTDYWSAATITMTDETWNQDMCQGATVNLKFAST